MLSCPVSTCVVKNKIFFFFCHNVLTLASLCDCSILFYYEICYNSVNSKKIWQCPIHWSKNGKGKRGFCRDHTSKALRYGTRSQGISQFYLYTLRSSANGINHTCLWSVITSRENKQPIGCVTQLAARL